MTFDMGSWTCHVCGEDRPNEKVSVLKTDHSKEWNLPPGTVMQNVRYCNDNPACIEGAKDISFITRSLKGD